MPGIASERKKRDVHNLSHSRIKNTEFELYQKQPLTETIPIIKSKSLFDYYNLSIIKQQPTRRIM